MQRIPVAQVKLFMEQQIPFNRFLGIFVVEISVGHVVLALPFRDEFIGDPMRSALHGGVVSTLIDASGGAAVWSAAESNDRVSTIDLRVDYLEPGPSEKIHCDARVVRIGNRVGVTDMRVFSARDPETSIATGKGVYNIKRS